MVCYAVPLAATVIVSLKRMKSRKKTQEGLWLNLLLLGGSIFGMVDHLWHGELFMLGTNLTADLALGTMITGGIFAAWGLIAFRERINSSLSDLNRRIGIYK